jgi:hypothetical protein
MAGRLIQINKAEITTATSEVILNGIDSNDVYLVTATGVEVNTDGGNLVPRVTVGGVADTTANYDRAGKQFRANTTFGNSFGTNATAWNVHFAGGTVAGETNNAHYYLYNFYDLNKYSFITVHESGTDQNGAISIGMQGAGVHTVNQSCDGMSFISDAGNIDRGNFVLYKVL